MKKVYAVENPQTSFVIGFVQLDENVGSNLSVPSFSISIKDGEKNSLHDVVLHDNKEMTELYDANKHKDIDGFRNEKDYFITLNGQDIKILRDTSVVSKLVEKAKSFPIKEVSDRVLKLAKEVKTFILKSFKNKPIEKLKLGDVIVIEKDLYKVTRAENGQAYISLIIEADQLGEESPLIEREAFRVGRY